MNAKAKQAERAEALERLREWVKPGDTLFTILRHVSRSGTQRTIDVVMISDDKLGNGPEVSALGWNIAKAPLEAALTYYTHLGYDPRGGA